MIFSEKACGPGCGNGGTCVRGVCRCPPGFTGKLCQAGESQYAGNHEFYLDFLSLSGHYVREGVCRFGDKP